MTQHISGELYIANSVLADLVGNAALNVYGVVGMAAPSTTDGFTQMLTHSKLRRGIVIDTTDEGIHVDIYVIIEYGTNINTVSQNLVEAITFTLTQYVQRPLAGIEVHVQGVKVR